MYQTMNNMSNIKNFMAALLLGGAMAANVEAQDLLPSTSPNETQRLLQERGYGMFVHFGMNTFIEQEWSEGKEPATTYNPTQLDCDQWVRVARDAGFRYVLLVTKHHDGFCLWDSKYTDYDVASSPVKTDVVKAVSDACRKYGLKFAVYYSLWDRHEPSYTSGKFGKYVKYMENQLTELMTNYGEVCELWLDGAWDKTVDDWQIPRIYSLVKKLQPHCAVGVNHTLTSVEGQQSYYWDDLILPDSCTEDNKYFMRFFPSDFRLWDPKIAPRGDKKQYLYKGKSYYLPFEHTICLSKAWNWFQKSRPMEVRELDELEELFYQTTANGNTLVVNIPPDNTGRIRENEANAVIELGRRIGIKPGAPLPTGGKIISTWAKTTASSVWENNAEYGADKATDGGIQTRWASATLPAQLVVELPSDEPFNKVSIFEYCDGRQSDDGFSNVRVNRIQEYSIDIERGGKWETVYVSSLPMGDCKVVRFPQEYRADKIRLNVTKASAPPSIYEFNVSYVKP